MNKPVAYVSAAPGYYVLGVSPKSDGTIAPWRLPIIAWAIEETLYDKPKRGDDRFITSEPVSHESMPSNWHAILDPLGRVFVPVGGEYENLQEYLDSDEAKEEASK